MTVEVHLRTVHDKNGVMVTICDAELLGETFRKGRLKLEVNREFYSGVLCQIEEAMEALANADIANLVGQATVNAAIGKGLVDPGAVINFGRVPHVQMVKL